MKSYIKLSFFAFFILLISSCKFSYNEPSKIDNKLNQTSSLVLAKKSLRFINENKSDSLKLLLNPKILKMVKPEQFDWLMKEGKIVIDNYEYPNDTLVIKSQQTNYSLTGKQLVEMYSFPFKHKTHKDSLKYFHITIADNEIYRLFLNNYAPGITFIEPKHTEPHKDKINMQTENLKWFRIWYDGGKGNNKRFKNEIGYFAVSGDKEKLEDIGIKNKFQKLFDLINNIKFDSLDFKYMREDEVGDPEWIYLRMKFNNEEYKNLGEFDISYFIKEENGKKEIMSDYIVLKHTEKTRYLIKKEKNPEIVNVLNEIAHYDYSGYYESYP